MKLHLTKNQFTVALGFAVVGLAVSAYILGLSDGRGDRVASEQLCHDVFESGKLAGMVAVANETLRQFGCTNLFPSPMTNPYSANR